MHVLVYYDPYQFYFIPGRKSGGVGDKAPES